MNLESLKEEFAKYKQYIQGVSSNTLYFYSLAFKAWSDVMGDQMPTKANVNQFIIRLRERGTTPNTCDAYARGFNSFLAWLHQEGYISEPFKVKRPQVERKVYRTLTEDEIRRILRHKPKGYFELRLHSLIVLALDTGCRIDELLTLSRDRVNMDDLLITVIGKGNKQRTVPMSFEGRKALAKILAKHRFELVFCTRHGGKLMYDNMRREFSELMSRLKIKPDGAFHAFRRTFARNFVRNGGDALYLQKFLGHTTLTMSRRYVELETDDLQAAHAKASPLARLR